MLGQIFIELLGLLWLFLYAQPVHIYGAIGRVVLTCVLGYWLYGGSRIARWLTVVLMGLGAVWIFASCYYAGIGFSHLHSRAFYQLLFAWMLVRDANIAAFFTGLTSQGGFLDLEEDVEGEGNDEGISFDAKVKNLEISMPNDDLPVIVTQESYESTESQDIIDSNIRYINELRSQYVLCDELSSSALCSYFVDYFLAEMENGGFSQFVYNSRWEHEAVAYVATGLKLIGAGNHLALFMENVGLVAKLGNARLSIFLTSEYWDDNDERDELDKNNSRFFELSNSEDLSQLNSNWLRSLSNLRVLNEQDFQEAIELHASKITEREARKEEAEANAPRYVKLIQALCDAANQELSTITAGDPTHEHEGVRMLSWHFITDKGHHYMVDTGSSAIMFNGETHNTVTQISFVDDEPDTLHYR